jgi:hypothetical protein
LRSNELVPSDDDDIIRLLKRCVLNKRQDSG